MLLNFAALGVVFARKFLNIQEPRVGLLSVGEETAKGNRQVQESYPLFEQSHLNFVGNVEGMDFFTDRADVIVCDGFVGNILLKFAEGLGGALAPFLRQTLSPLLTPEQVARIASDLWQVNNLPRIMGGPLFGVNGAVILGHGSSKAEGVAGAYAAKLFADYGADSPELASRWASELERDAPAEVGPEPLGGGRRDHEAAPLGEEGRQEPRRALEPEAHGVAVYHLHGRHHVEVTCHVIGSLGPTTGPMQRPRPACRQCARRDHAGDVLPVPAQTNSNARSRCRKLRIDLQVFVRRDRPLAPACHHVARQKTAHLCGRSGLDVRDERSADHRQA
jgi:hypothetical protein